MKGSQLFLWHGKWTWRIKFESAEFSANTAAEVVCYKTPIICTYIYRVVEERTQQVQSRARGSSNALGE